MDTPTSRTAKSPALPLDRSLAELRAGSFAYTQLAALSDLSREGARTVEGTWLDIPPNARRSLIVEAAQSTEANVEYQFNRLFRIALHDPEPDIRQHSISALWEDETSSLVAELLSIAESDSSADVRAAAIAVLANSVERLVDWSDSDALIDRIASLVTGIAASDGEPTVTRRQATESLGELNQSPEVRRLIQEAYEHGDQALEAGALAAMGRSLDVRWRPVVRAALKSQDAEIRFEAARSLGLVGTEDDVSELAHLIDDIDLDVHQAAILALGEIGGVGAVRVLRTLAQREDPADAEVIQDALENAVSGRDPLRGFA